MYEPTPEYREATARVDLAWRIAQRVKEAERALSAGHLETKEIRNAVEATLRESMTLEAKEGRCRLVTRWVHWPVDRHAS